MNESAGGSDAAAKYKKYLRPFLPDRFHRYLRRAYYSVYPYRLPEKQRRSAREQRELFLEGIPESLPEKHITDLKVVSDRGSLLNHLPANGLVAELGVDVGEFSEEIISKTNPDKLYLVDTWATDRYDKQKMMRVRKKFSNEIKSDEVQIVRSKSDDWLRDVEEKHLDWVYIDTTHSYEQTKIELKISRKKIKKDGVICGHDYCNGNVPKRMNYGVIPAVHEFCVRYNYEIKYLTLETNGARSFCLKSI